MAKILLFNPRSAIKKYRIPNSILAIAASINSIYDWVIVDGNCEHYPLEKLVAYLDTGEYKYVGFTVMPGPQTKQAIIFAKEIKNKFPKITMIWGGYFASAQSTVILESGYVDFVISGPGDHAFPQLIDAIEENKSYHTIPNLIFKSGKQIIKTPIQKLLDQDDLPPLPYDKLDKIYPIHKYLGKTYLGSKTLAYHSSIGCPFTCSFCAVVPIYKARWKAKSAVNVYNDIKMIKEKWGADAIEFHDNNFFVSEKRVLEFSRLMQHENMNWWGEGRIDTIDKYKDETLAAMRTAGCRMIFFGAETGNNDVLKQMDKGGTQSAEQIEKFAARIMKFDIIPEYSFVLGLPAENEKKVMAQIDFDIQFIKKIKALNPQTEIIFYIYSPVAVEGTELYEQVKASGFHFPETLEEWINPHWENFDLRKNPLTPWLTKEMVNKIRNFEVVLNGYFPTISDIRLNSLKRKTLKLFSGIRYQTGFYHFPYEIKLLHKMWKYRQPEIQGF